jgi:HD-GYP domain-containing protein (c-di-GMP phosphodiesterase class II)
LTTTSKAARILPAADQLDALSAEQPCRGRLPRERAASIMKEEAGAGTVLEGMPGDPLPQQ